MINNVFITIVFVMCLPFVQCFVFSGCQFSGTSMSQTLIIWTSLIWTTLIKTKKTLSFIAVIIVTV